jgi:hypothetical protein
MQEQQPQAVIPDNLSEMSLHEAWNRALDTIAPLAEWDSFWNDGLNIPFMIEALKLEKIDGPRKRIRYRNSPRRLVAGSQGLYSWRERSRNLRKDEEKAQLGSDAS